MRSSTPSSRSFASRLAIAVAGLALALAGCGFGQVNQSITVTDPWVRPPQGMDRPAAGYMVIVGGDAADALVGVTTAAAGMVEIHETTTDASGMSGMHQVTRLDIPAGGRVELKPGGYHLMLMQVVEGAIEVGQTIELELTFEKIGKVVVEAEVRAG